MAYVEENHCSEGEDGYFFLAVKSQSGWMGRIRVNSQTRYGHQSVGQSKLNGQSSIKPSINHKLDPRMLSLQKMMRNKIPSHVFTQTLGVTFNSNLSMVVCIDSRWRY